jgi:ankyrin repeat protein
MFETESPLIRVLGSGIQCDREALIRLINQTRDLDAQHPVNGSAALHYACESGNLHAVRYLCERKANINIRNRDGKSPLHFAASRGHLDIVSFLCAQDGISVGLKNILGQTPLLIACAKGHISVAVKLLKDSNQPETFMNEATTDTGWTPLHAAINNKHIGIALALIKAGARLDIKDKEGKTAVDSINFAEMGSYQQVLSNNKEALEKEIDKIKNDMRAVLARLQNALQKSDDSLEMNVNQEQKNADQIVALLKAKRNELSQVNTAIDLITKIQPSALTPPPPAPAPIGLSILAQVAQQAQDPWLASATPLMQAIYQYQHIPHFNSDTVPESVALEVQHAVSSRRINITNDRGATALHFAAEAGATAVAILLINSGASLSKPNNGGLTPLHLAAMNGHSKLVELLLERGADPYVLDNAKRTVYDCALGSQFEDTIQALEKFMHNYCSDPQPKRRRLDKNK